LRDGLPTTHCREDWKTREHRSAQREERNGLLEPHDGEKDKSILDYVEGKRMDANTILNE